MHPTMARLQPERLVAIYLIFLNMLVGSMAQLTKILVTASLMRRNAIEQKN